MRLLQPSCSATVPMRRQLLFTVFLDVLLELVQNADCKVRERRVIQGCYLLEHRVTVLVNGSKMTLKEALELMQDTYVCTGAA